MIQWVYVGVYIYVGESRCGSVCVYGCAGVFVRMCACVYVCVRARALVLEHVQRRSSLRL